MQTKPEVFIVETLKFKDERKGRLEGKVLTDMLELIGKSPRYYYIRTRKELKSVLKIFSRSRYRYLHLSCHGDEESIGTTLDEIKFKELGKILKPHLKKRRLFVSSCEVVNDQFAKAVMRASGCLSIAGTSDEVDFDQAAALWVSFYYLAFKDPEATILKGREVRSVLEELARLFDVPIAYYGKSGRARVGYRFTCNRTNP